MLALPNNLGTVLEVASAAEMMSQKNGTNAKGTGRSAAISETSVSGTTG